MFSMIISREAEAPFPNCEVPQLIPQCQHSSQVPARMFCILVPCPHTDTHTLFGKGNRRLPKISRDLEGKQTINEAAAGKSSPRLRQGVILCLSCLCVLLPWESGLSGGILLTDTIFWEGERPPSQCSALKRLLSVSLSSKVNTLSFVSLSWQMPCWKRK